MAKMSRIDIIARNGGDGMHYQYVPPPCYSSYPKKRQQRVVNGCVDCVFVSKCIETTYEDKLNGKDTYDIAGCSSEARMYL